MVYVINAPVDSDFIIVVASKRKAMSLANSAANGKEVLFFALGEPINYDLAKQVAVVEMEQYKHIR